MIPTLRNLDRIGTLKPFPICANTRHSLTFFEIKESQRHLQKQILGLNYFNMNGFYLSGRMSKLIVYYN